MIMDENLAMEFDKLEYRLNSVFIEFDKLSKKKPDDVINPYKLKIINSLLGEINNLFDKGDIPIDKFTLFEDSELPTYSDIVIVLTQFLEKLDYFRFRNIISDFSGVYWILDKGERIQTKASKYAKK